MPAVPHRWLSASVHLVAPSRGLVTLSIWEIVLRDRRGAHHTWSFARRRVARSPLALPSYLRRKSCFFPIKTARLPRATGGLKGGSVSSFNENCVPLLSRLCQVECVSVCVWGAVGGFWHIRGSDKGGLFLEPQKSGLVYVRNLECAPKPKPCSFVLGNFLSEGTEMCMCSYILMSFLLL